MSRAAHPRRASRGRAWPAAVVAVLAAASLAQLAAAGSAKPPAAAAAAAAPVAPAPGQTCELMPIALAEATLAGVEPGTVLRDVANGAGSGNFGWLTWAGDNGVPALVAALTPPGTSASYVDPDDPADRRVSVGDRVRGRPGVANSKQVRDALDALKLADVAVPTWDAATGNGANVTYRVANFALLRLLDYQLPGQNRITARFLGRRECSPPAEGRIDVQTDEDTPVTVTLSASDADSAQLEFDVTQPEHGTVDEPAAPRCVTSSGTTTCTSTVTYTPAPDHNGVDRFTYVAGDGALESPAVPVEVTIRPVNDPPVAGADDVSVDEGEALTLPVASLLANDRPGPANEAGQALAVTAVQAGPSTHGTVRLAGSNVVYEPEDGFAGAASFRYTVCDDGSTGGRPDTRCADGTVRVTVRAERPPVASDVSVATDEDTPVDVALAASDPDGDALSYSIVDAPDHGVLDPPATPGAATRTYRPAADFAGTDTFTYKAGDGTADSNTATVTVTVRPRPDAPVITSSPVTRVTDGETYAYDVDAIDVDDGDELEFSLPTHPAGMTIDPASGAIGWTASGASADVTVRVEDRTGLTDTQSFTIAVDPGPRPPVAADDEPAGLDAREDTPLRIPAAALLANDSDPDGDPLTIAEVSATPDTHGTVELDGANVAYVPDLDYNGPVSFAYRAGDGMLRSNTATVRLSVAAVNDAPEPEDDSATTADETLTIPAADLTANDSPGPADEAGQALTVTAVEPLPGTRGAVVLFLGNVVYAPPPGFSGTDSFAYTVCDDGTTAGAPDPRCAAGTVHVDVTAAPRPPVAEDLTLAGDEDAPAALELRATDPDGDPLTFEIVDGPDKGSLAPPGDGPAARAYTPDPDANGVDAFTFRASDGALRSNSATVTIDVREVNDAPVAAADAKSVAGSAISFPAADLAANDSPGPANEGSQTLTVTSVSPSAGTHGTVTLSLGTVTYAADPGFNGDATFAYEVCDDGTTAGAADPRCDEGEVTLTITQAPVAPVADDLAVTTDEDDPVAVTLSATDPSGDPLTYAIVDGPDHGTVFPPGPGVAERTYTPDAHFNGSDTFTYRANDGTADSNVATVTVTVRPVNDPPVATDDAKRAARDAPLTFPASDLTANDTPGPANEAAQSLDVASVSAGPGTHGSVGLAGGNVTYTPDPGFLGDAEFHYRVCDDGQSAGSPDPRCADATVRVTVAEAALERIAVSPASRTIAGGESVQFTATGTFTDGTTRDVTDDVEWTSSEPSVANVTPDGSATGAAPGTTTIAAAQDGVSGTASLTVTAAQLRSIVVEPAGPTILVGDTLAFRATGVLSDGTSESLAGQVAWTSGTPGVASIAPDGTATAAAEGTTEISATRDGVTGTSTLTVRPRVADPTGPTAQIIAPADGAEVTSVVDVVGTASDPNLLKYVLAIAPAGETGFTTIAEHTTPVTNGVLGQLDPTMLRNDLYTVRLTVFDRGGNTATATRTYQVARDQKVGNFSIAFQDLDIPLVGIPISINRVYDSRDKGRGDFGVGWRLDIQTLRIRANREQGTGWQVNRSGSFFPTYTLVPTDAHKVSLSLPDGRVEEFDLVPEPSSSVLFPLQFISAAYRPRSGTLGTLRPLASTGVFVNGAQPGVVELLDDSTFDVYDPQTFEYTAPSGDVYVIDKHAGVQSVRDTNGNTLTIGPSGITHSSGVGVTFTRDAAGRITQITDPRGSVIRYAYDANGDLASHTDAEDNRTTFTYNRSHGLLDIRDPRGLRASRNEYDDDGRLVAIVDPAGNRTTYEHDLDARQEIVRDRRGHATVLTYDADGNILTKTDPLGRTTVRTYDARGNELTLSDPLGNTTTFEYDARDNVIRREDPTGATVVRTYNSRNQVLTDRDPNGDTTTYDYDANGNLRSTTDPEGGVTTHEYDSRGNRLSTEDASGNVYRYTYDAKGAMLTHTDAAGSVAAFGNDANGNRLSETRTRTKGDGTTVSVVTSVAYDGQSRPIAVTDGTGAVTRTEYAPTGQIAAMVDPNGNRTTRSYDALGRLVRTTHPDGTAESYGYDADNNRTRTVDRAGRTTTYAFDALNRIVRTTHPDGSSVETEYDEAGRATARTDARGNRTRSEYDGAGRLLRVIEPGGATTSYDYDAAGNRIRETDPLGHETSLHYDGRGRLLRTTFADGTSQASTYDGAGRRLTATDEEGVQTSFGYDALGRLTRVTDALAGVTSFGYDELGNLTRLEDALGRTTRLEYDDASRVVARTLPGGEVETFGHDAAGNVTRHTDFNGQVTTREYDEMHRLTVEDRPEGRVSRGYTATGMTAEIDDASGEIRYGYDDRDRLLRVDDPDGASIRYGYDADGRRTSIESAAGTVEYAYDARGHLRTVRDPAGGETQFAYDAAGNRISAALPNGTRTTYGYDDRDRLTAVEHLRADDTVIGSHAYTLGDAGQRLAVAEAGGRSVRYRYDGLYRLVEEDVTDPAAGDRLTGYTYDAVGNRLTATSGATTTGYAYDADDRLLSAGDVTFDYDDNGNVVRRADGSGDVRTFDYDSTNRLVGTTAGAQSAQFQYDPAGNRIAATSGGRTTRYLVDADGPLPRILEERPDDGSPAAHYVFGDTLLSQARGATTSYYHHDALASTRALTDAAGDVTDTYAYDAFGNDAGGAGSTANEFRFAGERRVPELGGAYDLRARHYDPPTGRFMSIDPLMVAQLEEPLTLNRYVYANGDPVNTIDPTGEMGLASMTMTMPMPAIGTAINVALLMARLAMIAKAVAVAAVTTCAVMAAVSSVTAIGSGTLCDVTKYNVFYSGWDTPLTSAHIASAILGNTSWANLHRATRVGGRRWYRSDPRCVGSSRLMYCDEYPFYSTAEGGPGASLMLVPAPEQWYQGGMLSAFYFACKVIPNDPIEGAFGVIPLATPKTMWQCK